MVAGAWLFCAWRRRRLRKANAAPLGAQRVLEGRDSASVSITIQRAARDVTERGDRGIKCRGDRGPQILDTAADRSDDGNAKPDDGSSEHDPVNSHSTRFVSGRRLTLSDMAIVLEVPSRMLEKSWYE